MLFLNSIDIAEKRILPIEKVIDTVLNSSEYSTENIDGHLSLIEEVLPDWCKTVTVKYIKVDHKMDIRQDRAD